MNWINGEPALHLPLGDRLIQCGDGFFTTARLRHGRISLLPYHLERLSLAAQRLMFAPLDMALLAEEIQLAAESAVDGIIKVIISRGGGGRGYSMAGVSVPVRIICHSPAPAHYPTLMQRGVEMALSPVRLSRNPLFAGLKHLNRLEQVMIRAHLDRDGNADEALVLDTAGQVVECCAANLFWRTEDRVFTPRLNQAGVEGVMRRHIIDTLQRSTYTFSEIAAGPEALYAADEVIICNALMPVLPVKRIEARRYCSHQLFNYLGPYC
ncbi:aminodeoxychorismate lyase [Biostraticola tofi]|uniref:Aminodeoxychorismate lyase n=1 Tax=Biostraticola tofi TaxID=466109 RepID=A0A4R3Z335_9GAMM|nr:aminodeoxychorismate lyase [Biostraticola tofi]TCV98253.1 aminodeoxychorismate lyase apoprotein [Biostraticola tofi]